MTMLEKAIALLTTNPDRAFTLNELRLAAGVALRSQYRLSEQLKADGRVLCFPANHFASSYGQHGGALLRKGEPAGYRPSQYATDNTYAEGNDGE